MIVSFGDGATADLYHGRMSARVRRIPADLRSIALRKLDQLEAAERLEDLRQPPGNRLEALEGDRAGTYSVRVNRQWRLVFRWEENAAHEVRIVDYH